MVDKFTYYGSKISNNLSLDAELKVRIGKAATAIARLAKRERERKIQRKEMKNRKQ